MSQADVYSYGIILYEIYSRKFPFGKKTRFQIELEVVDGKRPDLPDDCPPFYMCATLSAVCVCVARVWRVCRVPCILKLVNDNAHTGT